MCGITGFIDFRSKLNGSTLSILKKMTDAIVHRGPDADGHFVCSKSRVALGHRRLSILDLSDAGSQPMVSRSRRYTVVFNGEIYNFTDLRDKLGDLPWKGHSDTEVLLEHIDRYGFEPTLKSLNGMFALAVFDHKDDKLLLARDRIGEKPLYYGKQGDFFFFSSELKPFLCHPYFNDEVDRDALCSFLRHSYVPAPISIYKGIKKVVPGTYIEIDLQSERIESDFYWNPQTEKQKSESYNGSEKDAQDELNHLLLDAVKIRMESDVPLGAFLSGGVDSSLIVALMQAQSKDRIKTFTIGFEEDQYNEAVFAKDIATHLKTDHTEMYVSSREALDVIPNLAQYWDEPFADSSQIPTYLVSKIAKQKVTVCLSGDGGDELFSGYDKYFWTEKMWSKLEKAPKKVRKLIGKGLLGINPQKLDYLYSSIKPIFPKYLQFSNFSGKVAKLAPALASETVESLYYLLLSHWERPEDLVIGGNETLNIVNRLQDSGFTENVVEWGMFCDLNNYLPDDILTKVDRASMAVSLEGRIPFLDHRVVEYSWTLPRNLRIQNGQGKHLLRQVLYSYVPQRLIDRPKKGFGIPIDAWIKGPLRDWACDLLSRDRLVRDGYFNPDPIIEKLNQYLKGNQSWHYHLWDVLMFQLWLDEKKKSS